MRPTSTHSKRKAETLTIIALAANEMPISPKLRSIKVKGYHRRISAQIPATSSLLEIVAVLTH